MMRRLRVFSLLLALMMLLTACGGGGDLTGSSSVASDSFAPVGGPAGDTTTTSGNFSTTTDGSTSAMSSTVKPTTIGSGISSNTSPVNPSGTTSGSTTTTTKGNDTVNYDNEYFRLGDGLANTYLKLKNEKELTVGFMGGSVTYGVGCTDITKNSFRAHVIAWLQEQFPDAKITQVNAAYPSACSAYGVYCVNEFLTPAKADLVFIEFAINDVYASSVYDCTDVSVQYESILRQLRTFDPTCDAVALYVTDANQDMTTPLYSMAAVQEEVAKHYGIPAINVGWQLRKKWGLQNTRSNGALSSRWLNFFADIVHPSDNGMKGYADIIIDCLETAFKAAASAKSVVKHAMPAAKNSGLILKTDYVNAAEITAPSGWTLKTSDIVPNLEANAAGSQLSYTFTGTGISLFLGGAAYEYSVDGGAWKAGASGAGNHPACVVEGLVAGKHTIIFRATGSFIIRAILVRG